MSLQVASIVFADGTMAMVNLASLELVESGGEADIYLWDRGGEKLVVKVFSEKQTSLAKPVERMATMLRRLLSIPECRRLPRCLSVRSFPVGFGSLGGRAVLVYRALRGFTLLSEVIDDPEKLKSYLSRSQQERRAMAVDVLRGLACLDRAGIAHLDLTTANTALGDDGNGFWVHLFDLETASIRGSREYPLVVLPAKDVHYMDSSELRKAGIPLRQPSASELPLPVTHELDQELRSWVEWSLVWYGLQLVAYVYTGLSPFHGLPQLSMKYWLEVVEREKRKRFRPLWPPKAMAELGFLSHDEYQQLRRVWDGLGRLAHIFYQVFVLDVAQSRPRPSLSLSAVASYVR